MVNSKRGLVIGERNGAAERACRARAVAKCCTHSSTSARNVAGRPKPAYRQGERGRMNIEPGSIRSSVLVALGVLALLLLLDPNHPFIVDHQAIPGALVTAFAVVTALQIRAR